jgi:hypothetical protein
VPPLAAPPEPLPLPLPELHASKHTTVNMAIRMRGI